MTPDRIEDVIAGLQGLIPFLQSHHCRTDVIDDAVSLITELKEVRPPRSKGRPPNGVWGGQYQLGWDHAVIAFAETIEAALTPVSKGDEM